MRVLSIDIGVKNFAMCIEDFDQTLLDKFANEYKQNFKTAKLRCDANNEPTEDYAKFLHRLMTECSKTLLCAKIDFSNEKSAKNKRGQVVLDNNIFFSIVQNLDKFKEQFDQVDYIVIERQLKTNPSAQEIEHHTHAYFINKYGISKEVVSFESRHKTRVLCCPKKIMKEGKLKNIDKPYRKKWTTNKVMNVMMERKDKDTFDYIFSKNKSKADDLSDTICQAISFAILRFIEK